MIFLFEFKQTEFSETFFKTQVFLIFFSKCFDNDNFSLYLSTNFEYIFYSGATILTFITPILTMRTIAEERKSGTEQLLLTSPLSITKVVLGKFISATLCLLYIG